MNNVYAPKTLFNKKGQLFIKLENENEFNVTTKIPQMVFLGETYTPSLVNTYQDFTGVDGSLYNYSAINRDNIKLQFWVHFNSYYELKSLRHQIYDLLMQKRLYRLRTDAEPFMAKFCYPLGFDVEPSENGSTDAIVTVTMENPSGFLFSLRRSNEQEDIWDDYPLGWHIPVFNQNDYKFIKHSFKVYNPSSKKIDPYYDKADLKIYVRFNGSSIKLTNKTTDTEWRYNEHSGYDDNILIDGIVTYVNGKVATNKTNYKNIVLAKGWNDFRIDGAASLEIIFSFPFMYL